MVEEENRKFKIGEIVAYVKRTPEKGIYSVEIGKIKCLCEDGAFVYYHTGKTVSKTSYSDLYKIENAYVIEKEGLGKY